MCMWNLKFCDHPKFIVMIDQSRNRLHWNSGDTTEAELCRVFSSYGNVKSTKIIVDRAGVSKGYGFVTFETEQEAQRLQADVSSSFLFWGTLCFEYFMCLTECRTCAVIHAKLNSQLMWLVWLFLGRMCSAKGQKAKHCTSD